MKEREYVQKTIVKIQKYFAPSFNKLLNYNFIYN